MRSAMIPVPTLSDMLVTQNGQTLDAAERRYTQHTTVELAVADPNGSVAATIVIWHRVASGDASAL